MIKMTKKSQPRKANGANVSRKSQPPSKTPANTKKALLIGFLSKEAGADVAGISKRFGWLPHTTRAALSRLRKAGYQISSMKTGTGKPTIYRITSAPAEQSAQ